jgi:phosphoribosylanthranilate isomerase
VNDTFDVQAAEAYDVDAIMLDTKHNHLRGGTGRVFDWSVARQAALTIPELYLAGGLSPENVENAIKTVRPYAVDACSALEDRPGKKNHDRMRVFINTVRRVAP